MMMQTAGLIIAQEGCKWNRSFLFSQDTIYVCVPRDTDIEPWFVGPEDHC